MAGSFINEIKMKNYTLILVTFFLVASCAFPTYVSQEQKMQNGVDFTDGKWLLNTIDAPYGINEKLTKLALKDFNKHIKNGVNYVPKTKGILLPQKISFDPSSTQIKELKNGTNFDYFINIKTSILKEQIGVIDVTSTNLQSKEYQNSALVTIEIYDLNNLNIIYSKTVNGNVKITPNSNNFYLANTGNDLILGAYKKIIKDIDKKSISK